MTAVPLAGRRPGTDAERALSAGVSLPLHLGGGDHALVETLGALLFVLVGVAAFVVLFEWHNERRVREFDDPRDGANREDGEERDDTP